MSEKMYATSRIDGGEWDYSDAYACADYIARVVHEIDKRIAGMDTTELPKSAFRIQNSWIFRRLGELRDEERMCQIDSMYIKGIDIISELLMKRNMTVWFIFFDKIWMKDEEYRFLLVNWRKFFHRMIMEWKTIHIGKDYNLQLLMRTVWDSCSFILEKVSVHSDE